MLTNYWADKPIHRILVYTEHGLTPEIVKEFFNTVECEEVYDPFVGSGTVGVEALLRGRRFVGADSNPAAVVLTAAKISPEMGVRLRPLPQVAKYHGDLFDKLYHISKRVSTAIEAGVFFNTARRFSLLEYSPAPKFKERVKTSGDPEAYFRQLYRRARSDIKLLRGARGDVIWADSTAWMPRRVCGVLTSPPFANNVDYARHTMVELLWLGIPLQRARDLQLPACEAAARVWKRGIGIDLPIAGKRARGYKRFLSQYIHYMTAHIELLAERLEVEAWYTIGDSVLGGAYVPTQKFVAEIAERAGLKAYIKTIGMRPMKNNRTLYLLRFIQRR